MSLREETRHGEWRASLGMGWEGETGRRREGRGGPAEKGGWSEQKAGAGLTGDKREAWNLAQVLGAAEFIHIVQELTNYNAQAKSSLPPDFLNTVLFTYCLWLLSCCDRDQMACKGSNIFCLALYKVHQLPLQLVCQFVP